MEQILEELEGTVENILFHNEENGFSVLEVSVKDELLTVVGAVLGLGEGEEILAKGSFLNHPTYGRQFKAEIIEHVLPATSGAILKYLSCGAIKGIGPVLAKRIVQEFGDDTLKIMDEDPDSLCRIKGITPIKAREITAEYKNILGIRACVLFLSGFSIEADKAISVFKKWGGISQSIISSDPYCLCSEDIGVPFEKADIIADRLGFENDASCRIKGGILYVLTHNLNNGHSCLPKEKLLDTASKLLVVEKEKSLNALLLLLEEGEIMDRIVLEESYIYLPQQFIAETYCGERLSMLLSFKGTDRGADDSEIDELQCELSINYAELQRKAIKASIDSPIMILTGGPGTGKTTTLNGIITLLLRRGMKVLLAAPTGRAAKRLSEVTGREAKTIHRLLEVDFGSEVTNPRFKHDERNPLNADAVVIDEMSMVDTKLFSCLLKALRMSSRLIMVGDPDQLPSVGAGNVLRDLINSNRIVSVHLEEVFRQASQSLIVTSAHEIVRGNMPPLDRSDSDFFFMKRSDARAAAETVVDLFKRRLPNAYGFNPILDIEVLCPGRQGVNGTIYLNNILQAAINPPQKDKAEQPFGQFIFRTGDKVMQIKNNYDIMWQKPDGEEGLGVFNGDIGFIKTIDRASKSIVVDFDEKNVIYPFEMLGQLEPAYAITIHKSQGNEFDAIIMPLTGTHKRLHYRNLLYTGVTRAKKLLIIVGSEATVKQMVDNDRKTLRYTNLQRIIDANEL